MQPAGKAQIKKEMTRGKGDFRDNYTVGKKLGEGTFGMVFECTKKAGQETSVYAVKMLEHQSSWWGQMSRSANVQWEMFAQEFEMLKRMKHPNVIRLHDVFADTHFLYFVMDKYENSLIAAVLPCLQKGKKTMPNACIGEITNQMCQSIVYLHDQKIVHRDVKADNYLVDRNTFRAQNFRVVLTDLSTARYLEDGVFLKEMLGTMQYWAPEIVARYYTHKVDCWAIGVILWCMLTMKFPFNTVQETYTKKLTYRADKMTHEQYDLVCELLEKNPQKRYSAKEAMQHKWVAESVEKHKQMVERANKSDSTVQDEADEKDGDGAAGGDDADAVGFGDIKKVVDKETLERRERNLADAKGRYDRGEGGCISMEEGIANAQNAGSGGDTNGDVVSKDKQRQGEAKMYSWWSEERCKEKNVPDIMTSCSESGELDADDPAREQAGDIALTEPSNVKELKEQLTQFKVDTSKFGVGKAKSLEQLQHELESLECRMLLRGKQVIRVVDLLVLRVRTQSQKMLIEESQNFKDGRSRAVERLPAVMRQAGGSGADTARSEISRLLMNELGTTTDVINVQIKLDDPTQEQSSYKQTSDSYPGLETVYRKTFFDGVVNPKASSASLAKLGLMDEKPFTTQQDDLTTNWQWWAKADIDRKKVVVSAPKKSLNEFEGFSPLVIGVWTEEKMAEQLKKHNVDTAKLGVGKARSVKEFVQETNTGETRLYSNGKELRRYLDILVVKIKNSFGAYLIETGHSFGSGQRVEKKAFPATKVRPFEDKVWAVRRLLGEVDIPYASSKIMFGPRRIEKSDSPSYPGVQTVYLKQVVEVTLSEIDVANLTGSDMGTAKWFAHGRADPKVQQRKTEFD
jgi:serine/threonine protein kinase